MRQLQLYILSFKYHTMNLTDPVKRSLSNIDALTEALKQYPHTDSRAEATLQVTVPKLAFPIPSE